MNELTTREEIATRIACAIIKANAHLEYAYAHRIRWSDVVAQSTSMADGIIDESEKHFKKARAAGRSA